MAVRHDCRLGLNSAPWNADRCAASFRWLRAHHRHDLAVLGLVLGHAYEHRVLAVPVVNNARILGRAELEELDSLGGFGSPVVPRGL